MSRQNFLGDEPWDEIHDKAQIRTRIFDRRPGGGFGASLHELLPGSPGFQLHMGDKGIIARFELPTEE